MDHPRADPATMSLPQLDGLCSRHHFAGDEETPRGQHLAELANSEKRLCRMVLDAFGNGQKIQHHRIGLVANGRHQGRHRFLHRNQTCGRSTHRRQIAREAMTAGAGQLYESGSRGSSGLGKRQSEALEYQRERRGVKITGRDHASLRDKYQRIVRSGIEFELYRVLGAQQHVGKCAVDRCHASQA